MTKQDIANKWTGAHCTLNGQDANIVGRLNDFGTVKALNGLEKAEYSWAAIDLVMREKSGAFKA